MDTEVCFVLLRLLLFTDVLYWVRYVFSTTLSRSPQGLDEAPTYTSYSTSAKIRYDSGVKLTPTS